MPANLINQFPSIQEMTGQIGQTRDIKGSGAQLQGGLSFEQVLRSKSGEAGTLKFSKHASERMLSRNIDLSPDQWERLESGVARAGSKGIKESLVMVDDVAFIVNTGNNTVVTAVDHNSEQVFTNIDGAVIA